MHTRRLTLANGLRCELIHQPQAGSASALLRVAAGSLDEPDRWPGLAHLLEHLLFCGGQRFSDDQRLMPWVQQQGGQINATTQLNRSAFFFQLPPASLPDGLARLADMLAAPQLTLPAIGQEIAVIDAEYQLLRNHADTLSEAALLDGLAGDFRRFRVGNLSAFGDNVTEVRSALRDFHQRYYVAANMQLWLSGPQSLDQLETLAQEYAAAMPDGNGSATSLLMHPDTARDAVIGLAGEERFWLTLIVPGEEASLRDNVTLLRAFWLDEAPGGLMAQLRTETGCSALDVQWLYQDAQQAVLALRFSAPAIDAERAWQIEQRVWQHLHATGHTTAAQQRHYLQLAQQDFAALSPLEQLRGRALQFAPPEAIPADFSAFVAALPHAAVSRLLSRQQAGEEIWQTQGFTLQRGPWLRVRSAEITPVSWRFYPRASSHELALCTVQRASLPLITPVAPQETLLLRPACYQTLDDDRAQARHEALRPLLAQLRHDGGNGSWQQQHGIWQLVLMLPAAAPQVVQRLPDIISALHAPCAVAPATAPHTIAIRQLLAALPRQLIAPPAQIEWLAAWCGVDRSLSQLVARGLPADCLSVPAWAAAPRLQQGITAVACPGSDQALLLFIPLPQQDDTGLAALRALALMFEPRFFQRLRVEQQVGYVVSARYQRMADVDGLLLALQSPSVPWRTLLAHCKRFLRDMQAVLAGLSDETLRGWQATLRAQCPATDNATAASEALRQQQGLPCLTPAAVEGLTLAHLQDLHLRLLRERRRWRVLVSRPA